MYKFVAIDIDGTLLRSDGEISNKTKNIIRRVVDRGVKVVLTSGRPTYSTKMIAKELSVDHFMICDNGASIYNLEEDNLFLSQHIDKETVLKIMNTCIENNIYYMVFTPHEIIVKDLKHMALAFYKKRHNVHNELSGINEIKYAGIEYIRKIEEPIIRIVVCDQDRPIFNSIVNHLKKYESIDLMAPPHISNKIIKENGKDILISYSYAELLPKHSNKWEAIKYLISNSNIKPSEVIAIGDNFNDIEMVKNAGLGVAVNNGTPTLKAVAQVVAPSNDEDGVATILEQYILKSFSRF